MIAHSESESESESESATVGTAPDGVEIARIEQLTITFPGQHSPAVDNVTLSIFSGECVALVGESGSGKSLTARSLLGLLPETATVTGRILLAHPTPRSAPPQAPHPHAHTDGTTKPARLHESPPRGASAWAAIRGAQVALVPQDALGGLDPLRRIEHEVGDSLRLHRLAGGDERRARVIAALAEAGMPTPEKQLRRRSDELSGGLRQRALVASALIADPQLIVADEPTTALDAGHRGRVLAELRRRVDAGAAALLISHDLASVRGVADRVVVMRDGRFIESGRPARVLTDPEHPFTRELLDASPAGKPRGTPLLGHTGPTGPTGPTESTDKHRSGTSQQAIPVPATGVTAGTAPPRLELHNIGVTFGRRGRQVEVLQHASLSVQAGETVGLVGESGSGKTTLLRVALGLQQPDTGAVCIDGQDRAMLKRAARRELRRRIGLVPQDPLDSFPRGSTGAEILRDALRAAGVPNRDRAARAANLAAEVDIDEGLLWQPAATLSGGQRQRIAIARALARDPELLLLDEPVSALDVTVQARVLDLLNEVQASRGTAYLLVSHDEDVIRHMSDRVLRLERGQVRPAG